MNKITKNMLLQALDGASAPIVLVAAQKSDWPILYLNTAAETLLQKSSADLLGTSFGALLAEGELPDLSLAGGGGPNGYCTDLQKWRGDDGESLTLQVRMTPILDRYDVPEFLMINVVDHYADQAGDGAPADTDKLRNKLVAARRTINSLQRTDSVSGLARRCVLEEILERDWAIARREQNRVAVIVFELDCFAEYQQIYGRHATDSLLRKIGHAIGGTLRRAGDLGARIADDRFAVLIGNADPDQARACAVRVAAKVRNLSIHHPRSTKARFATVSYGIAAEIPAWSEKSSSLLERAENRVGQDTPLSDSQRGLKVLQPVDEAETVE